MQVIEKKTSTQEQIVPVYCPICTHSVQARVVFAKRARVVPGQKCPRCNSALDAAAVLPYSQAA
jgi:transposase-like protein